MKPDITFSDFSKFLTSLGLFLISVSFAAPWLMLNATKDILIEKERFESLTPGSQTLLIQQQSLAERTIALVTSKSSWSLYLGIGVLVIGMILWARRQTIRNRIENADLKKRENELVDQSDAEVAQEVRQKVIEENFSPDTQRNISADNDNPIEQMRQVSDSVSMALQVEQTVAWKLKGLQDEGFSISTHQRLGNSTYDIVIKPKNKYASDVLVEVKYVTNPYSQGINFSKLKYALDEYRNKQDSSARLVVLQVAKTQEIADFINQTTLDSRKVVSSNELSGRSVTVKALALEQFNNLDTPSLKALLGI